MFISKLLFTQPVGTQPASAQVMQGKEKVCVYPSLEKEMATHPSVLAWRIPGMEEPGGLPSMGSHRVGHD